MPNYQNGKIYKITSSQLPNVCYIGSTTQALSVRMGGHRANYKRWLNNITQIKTSSIDLLCFPDAKIYLIHEFPCASKNELEREEGLQMRKYDNDDALENTVNKVMVGRTKKEYRDDNKEHIRNLKKEYYHDNKERLKEYDKEHKEHIRERKKKWYETQKHIFQSPTACPFCSSVVTKKYMTRHQKTKKCLKAQSIQS